MIIMANQKVIAILLIIKFMIYKFDIKLTLIIQDVSMMIYNKYSYSKLSLVIFKLIFENFLAKIIKFASKIAFCLRTTEVCYSKQENLTTNATLL